MASTYVNDLRLEEIGTGEQSGTWGDTTNTNLELISEALGYGTEAITTNADTHTSTIADGATDPVRSMYVKYTGTLDSACTITIAPNTVCRMQFIENATSGSQNIIISQGSGANITIPAGDVKAVYLDGAGSGAAVVDAFASLNVVDLKVQDDLTVTDDLTVNGDIDLEGAIDVNGTTNLDAVDIDGATQIDATVTVGVDDTGYDVKFFGATSGAYMLWDESADDLKLVGAAGLTVAGDADIDGTTNLDAVDIDGATQIDATVTVGVDDTGYDVKFFGATSGAYMLWDESADDLKLVGAAGLTVAGDIDVDGTSNLDVVDIDGAVDMASTLGVSGVVTANAGVVVDNITIDGTEIDLSSGDLTLDVAGDIILDADGGDVKVSDGGTHVGSLSNSSSDFVVTSAVQDKDIIFKGDDGGSAITALTLDMSDAGSAYFNDKVGVGTTGPGAALHVTHSSSSAYDDDAECIESTIIQNTNGSDGSGVNNYACLGFAVADGATSQGFINYVRTGDNTGKMTFLQRTAGSTYVEHMVIKSDGEIDGNFNDTSDIALKDNVTDMDSSLEAISQLNPSNFRWKGQDKTKSGFIAQDVEKCLPDLVSGEEGKKSIYTLGLVAHLTNAVQELKEIIEKQQKQINDMETK